MLATILGRACKRKKINCCGYFVNEEKLVKTFIEGGRFNFTCVLILEMARIFEKKKKVLHCNGKDTYIALMGNFNWGPISHNDVVSIWRLPKFPSLHLN